MSFNESTVRHIAKLSRIALPETQVPIVTERLQKILGFVEQLSAVDTTGVVPMSSVSHVTLPRRADVVTDGGYPEAVLSNAPEKLHGFYVVPKVVG